MHARRAWQQVKQKPKVIEPPQQGVAWQQVKQEPRVIEPPQGIMPPKQCYGYFGQCDSCGWYAYFRQDVPQEGRLHDVDGLQRWFLCMWCHKRSNGCSDWFHTAPRCDWCGWVGDDAGIQNIPKDVAAVHNYGIEDGDICEHCINRLRPQARRRRQHRRITTHIKWR